MKLFGLLIVVSTVAVLLALARPGPSAAQMGGGGSSISEVRVTSITSSSAVVSWKTEDSEPGLMLLGTHKDSPDTRLFNPVPSQYHAEKLIALTPDTTYFLSFQESVGEQPTLGSLPEHSYSFTTLPELQTRRALVGVVTSLSTDEMTVVHQNTGEAIDVKHPPDALVTSAGRGYIGNLSVGARVVVLAELAEDEWVAKRIVVKPERANLPISGIVVASDGNELIVSDGKGPTETVEVADSDLTVQVGELITVLKTPSGQAKSIYKAVNLQQRLGGFLEDLVAGDEPSSQNQQPSVRAERLLNLLESQSARQQQVFDAVLSQVPSQAKESLLAARAKLQDIGEDRKEIENQVREKFGLESEPSSQGQDSPKDQETEGPSSQKDNSGSDAGKQNEAPGKSEDKGNSGGNGPPEDKGSGSKPDDPETSSESVGAADSQEEGKDAGSGSSQDSSQKEASNDSNPGQGKNGGNGPGSNGGGGGGASPSPSQDNASPESDKSNDPGASGDSHGKGKGGGGGGSSSSPSEDNAVPESDNSNDSGASGDSHGKGKGGRKPDEGPPGQRTETGTPAENASGEGKIWATRV